MKPDDPDGCMLTPTGFWSYTSSDDERSRGRLSQLRKLLADELQQKIGRLPEVQIFQDVAAIPPGRDWERQIKEALTASSFFIPIVTPGFLQSEWCSREVLLFREQATMRGRDDLIFPLHYNDIGEFIGIRRSECHDPAVLDFLRTLQWVDFRDLRLRSLDNEEVALWLDKVAGAICAALYRAEAVASPVPPVIANPTPPVPAVHSPGSVIRDAPGPEMVLIPAGSFVMGIPPQESEREGTGPDDDYARPQHAVTIPRPFYLGKHPVTRGAFAVFARATGFADAPWQRPGFAQTDQHPIVCVSYEDAVAYAAWLSRETGKDYRLPSEAEWEYAARAGTTTARHWGDGRAEACRYANVADEALRKVKEDEPDAQRYFGCDDGFANTSPVGTFQPNGFGLYDMLGNVWERVADHWHDSYADAPEDGSAWTVGHSRLCVTRGGSWYSVPGYARAGYRGRYAPGIRNGDVGFRLARTL
jgi:formylglycine-generating enzyme required for sulfatase activity